jgi:hypothetical protein
MMRVLNKIIHPGKTRGHMGFKEGSIEGLANEKLKKG